MLDEDLIFSSQQSRTDNMKTFAHTVKLAYRNYYILASEGIYGFHKYVALIRGTVLAADTFSSKSAFQAQSLLACGLVWLVLGLSFKNEGSLRRKIKWGDSVVFLM